MAYIITDKNEGASLFRYLRNTFPGFSLGKIEKLMRTKKIAVFHNGDRQKISKDYILKSGDEVKVFMDIPKDAEKIESKVIDYNAILKHPKLSQVNVVFEDEDLLVVEKPAGVSVHPGSGVSFGHSLIDYCIALIRSKYPETPEPKLAHRIDKNTSGLVLVAKNDAFLRKITQLIREDGIQKKYLTLVKGKVSPLKGTIRADLIKTEGRKSTKIQAVENNEEGKNAVTHYEVKKYYPYLDASFVEVLLETGRMHQIRVHFASKSHPLAGDDSYGDFSWNKSLLKEYGLKRQFLHAYSLEFIHPRTQKKISLKSTLSDDLKKVIGD